MSVFFFVVETSSDGCACFPGVTLQRMEGVSSRPLTCGLFLQALQQTLLFLREVKVKA